MDRRSFLKLTSAALVGIAIPTIQTPIPKPKVVKVAELGLDPSVDVFFKKLLLERAEPMLVHNQFSEKRIEGIFEDNSKPIVFRKWAEIKLPTELLNKGVLPTNPWA